MKSFKKILEEVQTMNSDRETKLKDYQDKVAMFNSNKNKFLNILNSRPAEQWEAEAAKIINGNMYLAKKWTLDKLASTIDANTKKLSSGELSNDEVKELQIQLLKDKQTMIKDKSDIDKKIKDDLKDIKTT